MSPLELNINVEEVPTDLSRCYTCKETIFGKMFQYILTEGEDKSETKYKICESCYNLSDEA